MPWSQFLVVLTELEDGQSGLFGSTALAEMPGSSHTGRQGLRLKNVLIIDVRAVM